MFTASTRPPAGLNQRVRHLISRRKHVALGRLRATTSLAQELHFDLVDVVDSSLEVERHFQLTIPDEVPLHTVGDLVRYVRRHHPTPALA